MENRIFKHQELLKENNIEVTAIPDNLLQKRIRGFDELLEDYEHTVDEDREQMKTQIIKLDLELEEDLYELYDAQLDNNDDVEEDAPKKIEPKVEEVEKIEKAEMEDNIVKVEKSERVVKKKRLIVPTPPVNKDEVIIEKLIKNGYSSINRVNLRKLGFEGVLEEKRHHVGKYILTKAAFNYTFKYHIAINPNL